jgi:signal transduction histidine kinase
MKILVVDDELDEIESLSRGLKSRGHKVLAALNAQEALNYFHQDEDTIDLVITDYSMPGRSGIDLLSDIRKKDSNVPIMMMTAYARKDTLIDALRNRCDGFIEKPFTLEELITEIGRTSTKMTHGENTDPFSQLIPMYVHQINNPLTCISGSAEYAISKIHDSEALKRCMQRIIDAVESISSINQEILAVGRAKTLQKAPVSVRELIDSCLASLRDLFSVKHIIIDCPSNPTDMHIWGSGFDLEQLIKNLLSNAVDAVSCTPLKRIRIIADVDQDASMIIITVEDTGCGIPGPLLSQIYEPYFTLKRNGTGLGLTVVKKIMDEHGGRIDVESAQMQGTRFLLRLPRYENK